MRTRQQTEHETAPAPKATRAGWRERRRRRELVDGLRVVARKGAGTGARRQELLVVDRAAAVRTTVLQIAALLDQAPAPDSAACARLGELLRNGCSSPLYNRDVDVSELYATLDFVVGRLAA